MKKKIIAGAVYMKNVLLRLLWIISRFPITSFIIYIIIAAFYYGLIKPRLNGVHDCSKGTGPCRFFVCDNVYDDGSRANDITYCVRDNHDVGDSVRIEGYNGYGWRILKRERR
jgi:hypothetical protein